MKNLFIALIVMILASSLNVETYASSNLFGNRPKVRVLNKKKRISKQSSNYSMKFNARNINKCPKMGRRKRGFLSFR